MQAMIFVLLETFEANVNVATVKDAVYERAYKKLEIRKTIVMLKVKTFF